MPKPLSTYQMLRQLRPYSREHGRLVRLYAEEQHISLSTAFGRIYRTPNQVDASGNFHRKARSDKGAPQVASKQKLLTAQRALQEHHTLPLTEVAAITGLSLWWIRRVNKLYPHHQPPLAKSAPGTMA